MRKFALLFLILPTMVGGGALAPGDYMAVLSQASTASGPTVLLQDDFNRADSSTSLGTADVGGTWTLVDGGNLGISGNKAYCPGSPGIAVLDAGTANFAVQVTITSIGSDSPGIIFRYKDTGNWWRLVSFGGGYYIGKMEASSFSNVQGPLGTVADGDTLKAVVNGTSIKCYINDVQIGTEITSSFNSTEQKAGIIGYGNTPRLDAFLATTP